MNLIINEMKGKCDNFIRNPLCVCVIVLVFSQWSNLPGQVKLSEQKWTIPTYVVSPPDKNPVFFKGETYQGASKYIYPYAMNDAFANEKTDKAWKALILENEYIKLCVTPEIGGKLYYATDKTNNYNFVYKNDVVKPSNIGMTGAWVSGGIEWCVIHHHRASTFLPVDYELAENKDGSKTIWIGETEPRHRMRWTIGITAYPGKSYYSAEVKIHNPTPFTNTFLYWANVAAHTNKDYQVIFPPSVQFATYHAKNSFTNWPFSTEVYNGEDFTKGVDVSWWINSVNQNSFFAYDLKEDFMGGYDHGKESGTIEIGDHNIVKGAKLWEWGSGPRGQATEGRLTDNSGPYVEIMVGAFSDNQPDYSWIRPYEVKTFKQYWYPVKDIQGFKNANLNGAVNLEKREENNVFLGYYSTQKVAKARIVLKRKDVVVFEKTMEVSPEKTFTGTIKIEGPFGITDLSTEMINMDNNEVLISYHPVEKKEAGKLPETVKRPALPKDIQTVEELYLTGSRILQFYNPTFNAMDYFEEALKRDPNDIRTNVAVGNTYLKNGDYATARMYFLKAIKRLTKDYTRPSACEALYLEGLTLKGLELYDEAIDTLYRATWDYAYHSAAYIELARISCIKGDFQKALDQINESLKTNAVNNSAITLKASIQRRLGNVEGAMATLSVVIENDPLDFRAANENYLIAKKMANNQKSEQLLAGLIRKMRDFDENYLELAVGYLNDGLYQESEEVLRRFKGKDQMISYYLGYLRDKNGNKTEAQKFFKEASDQSVDYGFPYRLEDIKVLNLAMKYNPNDGKPYYYLGNLLYDKQPQKAIESWENAVKYDPLIGIAWRNLGYWGYSQYSKDLQKAINAYEHAFAANKNEPLYYAELDPLYEMSNAPIEKRAKLFEGNNEIVKKRDDSFVREIMVLNLIGESEKAVEYLNNSVFHYREGSSRVRDITVDAHLLLGKKYFSEKKYEPALKEFLSTVETPDNTQTGRRTGDTRSPQINYYVGLAYAALGKAAEAKSSFTLSTEQVVRGANIALYFQGLSFLKLGNKEKAAEKFNSLIQEGNRLISQGTEVDFFAKFGEREAANVQLSNAYMFKGLGYRGLGDTKSAEENLKKAVELSASNLWAINELQNR
jgi:tetratricopeptide (TPR) repeat protein